MLKIIDIHTYYGDSYVLQGISLEIPARQVVALLGRNGVGKTTLIRSIVGFTPARRGRILFQDKDITHLAAYKIVRMQIGLVPQGRRIFPSLTVQENLAIAARASDGSGWNFRKIYALFPRLEERRNQQANTMSGGEQQMLAIARALISNPIFLLMDEPTEGLAPVLVREVGDAILRLKEGGLIDIPGGAEPFLRQEICRLCSRDEQGENRVLLDSHGALGESRHQTSLSGGLTGECRLQNAE